MARSNNESSNILYDLTINNKKTAPINFQKKFH